MLTISRGRPPKYVIVFQKGDDGIVRRRVIVGLSKKSDGRYYTTHNCPKTGRRIYFGKNRQQAIRNFLAWQKEMNCEAHIPGC